MDENLMNGLDAFNTNESKRTTETNEKIVITSKTGLVERIEKKIVTQDGRELLNENF